MLGDTTGVPAYEHFAVGGVAPPLFDRTLLAQRLPMPALPVVAGAPQVASARFALQLGIVEPFFWAASFDAGLEHWLRVAGADVRFDTDALPLVRLPGMQVTAGVGHTLDEPLRRRWSWYSSLRFQP
jgi:hypothetical protein